MAPAALLATAALAVLLASATQPDRATTRSAFTVAGAASDALLAGSRACFDVSLSALVGCLLVAAWAAPDVCGPAARARLSRAVVLWSTGWALTALAWGLATASQVTGRGLMDTATSSEALATLGQLPQGKALVLCLVAAGVVGTTVARASRRGGETSSRLLVGSLVLVLLAVCPLLLTGHAASSSNHYLSGQTVLLHVLAVVPWIGGLLVLATHLRGHSAALAAVLPRFSRLAGACFVVVALSGLAGAWTRLGADPALWRSTYGGLLVVKVFLLGALGLCGAAHRRWTVAAVQSGRRGGFNRLAAGELVIMGTAVALGVVVSRTAPPSGALTRAAPPHASAFATVDGGTAPLGLRTLLLGARPDALLVTVLLAVAIAALVWRLGRPDQWPLSRVTCFLLGLVVVLWSLCGGLGAYSAALVSAQVGQLLVLALVAPVLLVVGAPRPLRGRLQAALTRWSAVDGLVAVVVLFVALWSTPLLALTLPRPLTHTALALLALACGLSLVTPLLTPSARDSDPVLVLGVLAVVILAQAAQLARGDAAVAGGWFARLDWWWTDPARDQHLAALVTACFGVLIVVVALARLLRERSLAR